jgi:hypothetical protein
MNYYESVVIDYLRADRALFINTECCIQLNPSDNPDSSGPHWYCDAVACDFRSNRILLCEISYSTGLSALAKRLREWHAHWPLVCAALQRDSFLPEEWPVRPWLFVPESHLPTLLRHIAAIRETSQPSVFVPLVTTLEMVQPWRYRSWNRVGEGEKPASIPADMHI